MLVSRPSDRGLQLNSGRFKRYNMGSGYVLKPPFLRDPAAAFNPYDPLTFTSNVMRLTIRVCDLDGEG
jgi:hypothetical protein